jgi:hypothetical protein
MEVRVSKGFLLFAQNTDTVDYVEQAYALALSIKYSQTEIKNVSLVTSSKVPKRYRAVFDNIIPIPWFTEDKTSLLKGEHRWKMYEATPYEETIVLDADMLLLEDITIWWKYCSSYDIKFCSKIYNYKLDYIPYDKFHRKTFLENQLPNPYFALHYFKKNRPAYEFYKVLEFVCNNWEACYDIFAPAYYQKWLSMDLATAITLEITGMYDQAIDKCDPLSFIHMKTPLQAWPTGVASWQDMVPYVLNSKGELIVGNIKQTKLFHYVEKNFISTSLLARLEELANGS